MLTHSCKNVGRTAVVCGGVTVASLCVAAPLNMPQATVTTAPGHQTTPVNDPSTVEIPERFRTSDYRAPVPASVPGASVIETPLVLTQFLDKHPDSVLIDVYPADQRPPNLPADHLWIEPRRQSLPGAVWLANIGYGVLDHTDQQNLKTKLQKLSRHNKETPLVFFCEPNCWHSWNAAKRTASYGYQQVYWYMGGTRNWQEAGYPLQTVTPEAL